MTKDPTYLDLAHCSAVPCREFLFGTDTMGRDIFSMIWYGGRIWTPPLSRSSSQGWPLPI